MFKRRVVLVGIGTALFLAGIFIAGIFVGASRIPAVEKITNLSDTETEKPEQVDFSPFWEAWRTVDEKFVATGTTTVPVDARVWGAIQGMVDALGDPYSVFLPPEESEMFAQDIAGNFGGVGMEVGMRDGVLTVISPLRGSPAEAAGVAAGDQILAIDGTPAVNFSIDEAVRRIRGESGTTVELTLVRGDDDPFEVSIVRDIIRIPTINTFEDESGVFVIELFNFNATSPQEFRRALRLFVETDGTKLILDLRGNPGGFLEAAIDISSWFLPPGAVVVEESFDGSDDGNEVRVHRSRGFDVFDDRLEMVVLVNGGSASASEIVAGALSEHGVATLVGTQTFGKGSVQELVEITPQTALKLTVARWLTPEGNSISQGGLTPDIVVEMTQEDLAAGRDPQLERAIEILK